MTARLPGPVDPPPPLPPPEWPSQPPAGIPAAPPTVPRPPRNPWLALLLSIFPGVGQIYNGQPAKALVFFCSWVFSIYATVEIAPLPFAFLIPFVYFYNLVDAYRSAAIINARGAGRWLFDEEAGFESPTWGAALAGLGVILLLNNLGWLRLWWMARLWPLLLIVAGGLFLASSLRRRKEASRAAGPLARSADYDHDRPV